MADASHPSSLPPTQRVKTLNMTQINAVKGLPRGPRAGV